MDSEQRAPILKSMMKISNKLKTPARVFDVFLKENKSSLELESATGAISSRSNAQCVLSKVRCHCIFSGPGIRYSDIFCATGIRYSVIIKLPCALLQTGHLETVHAPVADTVTYFAGLDAPVVDTVTYFGGNHGSRV